MATKLYFNNKTPDYNNRTQNWPSSHGWFAQHSNAYYGQMLDTDKIGEGFNVANTGRYGTSSLPFNLLVYRGISRKLLPQTISGTLDGVFYGGKSEASPPGYTRIFAYVIDVTGFPSTPPVFGYLLNGYNEYPSGANGPPTWVNGTYVGFKLKAPAAVTPLTIPNNGREYRLILEYGVSAPVNSPSGELHYLGNYGTRTGPNSFEALNLRKGNLVKLPDLTPGDHYIDDSAAYFEFSQDLLFGPFAYGVPNHEPEQAISLGVSPFVTTVTGASRPTGNEARNTSRWYKIPGNGDKFISILLWGPGPPSSDFNIATYLTVDPAIDGPPLSYDYQHPKLFDSGTKSPMMMPGKTGLNTYLRLDLGDGTVATMTVVDAPADPTAAGQICITGDNGVKSLYDPTRAGGDPSLWYDRDGNLVYCFDSIVTGELGSVLADGKFMMLDENFDQVIIYNKSPNIAEFARLQLFDPDSDTGTDMYYSAAGTNMHFFYVLVGNYEYNDKILYKINKDGKVSAKTWLLTTEELGSEFDAFAVSRDGKIAYIGNEETLEVYRHDLEADVPLPAFPCPSADFYDIGDVLILSDGTIAVGFFGSSDWVYHYAPDGTVLHIYQISRPAFIDHLTYDTDDSPDKLWVWTQGRDASSNSISRLILIQFTSNRGVVEPDSFVAPIFGGDGVGPYSPTGTPPMFGHASSCPAIMMMVPKAIPPDPEFPEVEPPEPPTPPIDLPIDPTDPNGRPIPRGSSAGPSPHCEAVSRRLGDPEQRIWTDLEIDGYFLQAIREMSTQTRILWDWTYAHDLPRGFSFTAPFEYELTPWHFGAGDGAGDGLANFTAEFERRTVKGRTEDSREGPARYTFPDELPFLTELKADQQQATTEMPHRLTEIERVTWDQRSLDADTHLHHRDADSRYEIETGEVFTYTWRKDGPRTLRKIRVPSAVAQTMPTLGSWGVARHVDTEFVNDPSDIRGSWGAPRRVPGEHPIGPRRTRAPWGAPRQFISDNRNVRVEHWRVAHYDCLETEIPERYRKYVEWYAMYRCLTRQSPGQNVKLAEWYKARWADGLTRIARRIARQQAERTGRLGGADPRPGTTTPPRPKLPWQYGSRIRNN